MNIPYSNKAHLAIFKRRIQGIKVSPPNAFGDSPNNAHYVAFDVPGDKTTAFLALCVELHLHTGWFGEANYAHSGVHTYVIAKYVKG